MKIDGNTGRKIAEIILTIGISTILMLLGMYYIPWIILLYPAPFIVLGVKYGLNYNIISIIVSAFFIGLVTDNTSGIFVLLAFSPLSVSLNYLIANRKKPLETMIITTLVSLASFLLILGLIKDMVGVSIVHQLDEFFTQTINTQIEGLKDMQMSHYEILQVEDFLESAFDYVLLIIPSIIMIFSLITAYINYFVSSVMLRKIGYGIASIPRFSKFRLPSNILLGTGIMFLGAFLLKWLKLSYYETVLLNITVLATFMFFSQGLSVIDYRLIKRNIGRLFRILILLFFIFVLPIGGIITFVGILDAIIDFRKFEKNA